MPDSSHTEENGPELAQRLRRNIVQLRDMLRRNPAELERSRVERLLAEAEAALAEIEIPGEG